MKKIFFISLSILIVFSGTARNEGNAVVQKTIVAGHTASNQPITATEFNLQEHVFQINIDSENNTALLVLRDLNKYGRYEGSGHLGLLNCNTGQFAWQIAIKDFNIQKTKDVVILGDGAKVFNLADGKEIAAASGKKYLFTDYKDNIGYDGDAGFDLTTGVQLWQHSIKTPEKNTAESVIRINDSMVAFAYSGLHVLNIRNGKGWDYQMVTSRTGHSGMGAEMNMLPGVPVVTGAGSILKTNIMSNIGYDRTHFYLADWIGLMGWDVATGKVLWEQEIDTKMMSRSQIFIKENVVYLLNRGAVGGNYKSDVNAGTTAFLAAYNKYTGAPLFFDTLGKQSVSSFLYQNNDCWIYNGNCYHINLENGKYETFRFRGKGAPDAIALLHTPDDIFVETESGKLEAISARYTASFVLEDYKTGVLRVYDNNGSLLQTLQPADYWQFKQRFRNVTVFDKFDGQLIFEKDGRAILTTGPANSNDIYADKLYRVVDGGLQVVELPEVLVN